MSVEIIAATQPDGSTIVGEPTFLKDGRKYTHWKHHPWPVHGGWRVAKARWVRDPRDGWDQEHEFVDPEVYETEVEAAEMARLITRRRP